MATRPEHHHPGSGFDPAVPEDESQPGLNDGLEQMGHTAGQPDNWPQRPDVPVEKSKTEGLIPAPIE